MTTLPGPVLERWQQPASIDWESSSGRWRASKRYVTLILTLLILSTLISFASAARPATNERAVPETVMARELAHEADMRWMQGQRADLQGRTLQGADLTGADLRGADLREADLAGALLLGTHLREADMRGAVLRCADLHYAVLTGADLRGADLRWANLQWIDLQDADLRGATLTYARLNRAYLHGAILPDGTRWVPGRDLSPFTRPAYVGYGFDAEE